MRPKKLLSVLINLFILVITVRSVWQNYFYVPPSSGVMFGTTCFRFYTILSNILVAASALPMLICELRGICPKPVLLFKHAGTTSVTVTLLTVLFFLLPQAGAEDMFGGPNLYMHLLTPLLAIISFVLLDGTGTLPLRTAALSVLPTVVYALVYVWAVVFSGVWPDFYGFNAGGRWYIALPVMLAVTLLIALALALLRQLIRGKRDVTETIPS